MNFEKTMCDRLYYKYRDIFNHLEFILNKTNDLLKNYGCYLSEDELKKLNDLFFKLETGQCEIIEFQNILCKFNTEDLQQELQRKDNIIKGIKEFIEWHYKDNQEFYKNKGIGLNYPEVDYILDKINELEGDNK